MIFIMLFQNQISVDLLFMRSHIGHFVFNYGHTVLGKICLITGLKLPGKNCRHQKKQFEKYVVDKFQEAVDLVESKMV